MTAVEANFDGIVGPTHNYSGLAFGNVASVGSRGDVSNPREAALQGLAKMKFLADLGVPQGILPPQERPHLPQLRRAGFEGSDAEVLRQVAASDPALLARMSSASAMWAANAATFTPSADAEDDVAHFTAANLVNNHHRAIESRQTSRVLRRIFPAGPFVHHSPVPDSMGDEGAANHTRLAPAHGEIGVEVFTYGSGGERRPSTFPGRQHFRASQMIARQHQVSRWVLVQQNPAAIDRGVFHNDVIAVGNLTTLFLHEEAWLDQPGALATLRDLVPDLNVVEVPASEVPVEDAVASYLFNSQLVTAGDRQLLIAPEEIHETPSVARYASTLLEQPSPIDQVVTFDLRQSMRNGGGPACLRLRVVLTESELDAVLPAAWLDPGTYARLVAWVNDHYRDELTPADLADPALLDEGRRALDELTSILELGPIYDFQR